MDFNSKPPCPIHAQVWKKATSHREMTVGRWKNGSVFLRRLSTKARLSIWYTEIHSGDRVLVVRDEPLSLRISDCWCGSNLLVLCVMIRQHTRYSWSELTECWRQEKIGFSKDSSSTMYQTMSLSSIGFVLTRYILTWKKVSLVQLYLYYTATNVVPRQHILFHEWQSNLLPLTWSDQYSLKQYTP